MVSILELRDEIAKDSKFRAYIEKKPITKSERIAEKYDGNDV